MVGLGDDAPLFMDEELTSETYKLFKKAKNLKLSGYKYVWHKNGTVLARKDDGDKYVIIKDETFLDGLLQ